MLATALQVEVDDYIQQYADLRDDDGHRMVVRNGYKPTRTIQTGLGDIEVTQPRVNDRRTDDEGNRIVFTSKILPPFLRKTRAVEELIPWLYLKGISTGDFSEALAALLGPDAPGLSASTIVRLKEVWQNEFEQWNARYLDGRDESGSRGGVRLVHQDVRGQVS